MKRERRPPYTFKSGATYDGEWKGNMRDGWGIQVWPDGAKYEGTTPRLHYITLLGEWRNNKAHGKGKFWHVDGDIFDGNLSSHGLIPQVNGLMIKLMDMVFTFTSTAPNTRANGRMISKTAMVLRHGLMALSMRVTTRLERNTTRVSYPVRFPNLS
jgi:hypothetical protein